MNARQTSDNKSEYMDRFIFEREHFERGFSQLAGVDEAGRGPLAGPVVAAAAVLPEEWIMDGIPEPLLRLDDSKKLTEKIRGQLFSAIEAEPMIRRAVAIIDSETIDRINILQATHRAMNEAITKLDPPAEYALIDGNPVKSFTLPQTAIVKGDSKSYSIAAASILAKVTRDRLMLEHHKRWPEYGFSDHKGYGTAAHMAAIEAHGPCPIHRRSFAPLRAAQTELF